MWALLSLGSAARRRLSAGHTRPRPAGERRPSAGPSARRPSGFAEGKDLLRYPARLGDLESRLSAALSEAESQATHLRLRGERVASKDPTSELVGRYLHDAGLLEERAQSMRRVLALVWRTRALLSIRAHVAITARARPDLSSLPGAALGSGQLAQAADAYEASADRVRSFVSAVEGRLADLRFAVPSPPAEAAVGEEDHRVVEEERARAERTYSSLQTQMDQLADTLGYLADRCLTRQVVEHSNHGVDGLEGSEGLFEEVAQALKGLGDLAQLTDETLADSAMDNLVEDISQLEQAGLDAQAEADAALEVEKLLEQFPTHG